MLTPRWLIRPTNEVRSSRGVQPSPIPASVQNPLEHLPDVPRVQRGAEMDGEHQPGILPSSAGQEPLVRLGFPQQAERLSRHYGQGEGAA